ncbi:hypothetical protein E5163_03715 [Marinicauda algicola]|uniref:Antifreeze glycopeptide n=1 Tax=Marinicauda algicola TaxID=2029849 RepID=A0A4V3RYF8_9PROT|nr:hypothetical protein [Marinicauda algicola]TGY90239.1 hypothetical protein E5163_03715 [Marinicauda algicola]
MNSAARLALAAAALLAAGSAAAQEGSGIEVRQLGTVDPFQVAVSDALPERVWSSGDAAVTEAVLAALPGMDSEGWNEAAAARLAARALLSGGPPPQGAQDSFQLAALRADRALAAAGARPVFTLLERTPQLNQSPALSRVHAEAGFALGETEAACRSAEQLLTGRDQPYWLRARAACSAFAGNIAAAELAAELARSVEPAPVFDTLFDAYTLDQELPGGTRPTNGLELALAHAIAPDAALAVADAAPGWLAEAAQGFGPPIALPELLSEALEAAMAMDGAERATVLGALAGQDLDRTIAAEALAVRLEEAAASGRFVEVARAYGDEVATLPITGDTLAYGRHFVLAAILAGDLDSARIWREALFDGPPAAEPEAPAGLPDLAGPGAIEAPAGLTPPASAKPLFEPQDSWTPPSAETLVALDYALAIAEGEISGPAFEALLLARIEGGEADRLAEAAGLVPLGAPVPARLRLALQPVLATEAQPAGNGGEVDEAAGPAGPVPAAPDAAGALVSAAAGALAESQLQAARTVEALGVSPRGLALAAFVLAEAGLEDEARRLVLEVVAEGAM